MTHRPLLAAAVVLASPCLLVATTLPAAADVGGSSAAVIALTTGALQLTVADEVATLGEQSVAAGRLVITQDLGRVTVDDQRNAGPGAGWVVDVVSTPFSSDAGPTIAASAIRYTAGPITGTGTASRTANDPTDLTVAVPAVIATGVAGDNSATWSPTITVTVPPGAVAGIYTATVTHSVA